MSWKHHRQHRDGNHAEIVKHLRSKGVEVIECFQPLDLLVYNQNKAALWLEIKTGSRSQNFTRKQLDFISLTTMTVHCITTKAEAVEAARHPLRPLTRITEQMKLRLVLWLLRNPDKQYFNVKEVEKILNGAKKTPLQNSGAAIGLQER